MKRLLALVGLLAVSTVAAANPPREPFWDRVAHPSRGRFLELVAQGRTLFEQERAAAAVEPLGEAVRLDPEGSEAWYYLGQAYLKLDRWAECADALAKLDALHPDGWAPEGSALRVPEPAFSFALCSAMAGRLETSVSLLERALARGGLDTRARAFLLYNLGDSYHALGRLEDAIRAYEQAIAVVYPQNFPAHALGLAVALDRDEQGERAREVLLGVVSRLNPALSSLANPANVFVLPEDEDYYRGLAYEVVALPEARKSACLAWTCRPLARAHFRRYLQRAPESPWKSRAEAHLADLGGPAPGSGEIVVQGGEGAPAQGLIRLIERQRPRLLKCVEGKVGAVFVAEMALPGKRPPAPLKSLPDKARRRVMPMPVAPLPPDEHVRVNNLSAGPVDETARRCVLDVLKGVKLPTPATATRIVFPIAP